MTNQHIRHIRIYHKDHFSYKKLQVKPFFSFLETTVEYKHALLEVLINLVRDLNPNDKIKFDDLLLSFEEYIDLSEVSNDIDIPEIYKDSFIAHFKNAFYDKNYVDQFRGDSLEYLVMYLENPDNIYKMYHEPLFYHKRKRIPSSNTFGSNSLIDIVKRNKANGYISLIECKANLDNNIMNLKNGAKFDKKLALMDTLEIELSKYVNNNNRNIRVKKALASIVTPKKKLPTKFKNYEIVDIYDNFRLRKVNSI